MVGFCLVPESKSQPAVEDKKKTKWVDVKKN